MRDDIESRKDIERLVNAFYAKVKMDTTIGHYFTEVVNVNWEKHLPRMYDFWENVLFYRGNYAGNPMQKHLHIHQIQPIRKMEFLQWNKLFNETVDDLFEGGNAEIIKQRAQSISSVMQIKMME